VVPTVQGSGKWITTSKLQDEAHSYQRTAETHGSAGQGRITDHKIPNWRARNEDRNKTNTCVRDNKRRCFYVLLTVQHLGIILVNNQLEAQLFFVYVYFSSLHVSSTPGLIIRRINCINTTSGICHSMQVTVWYASLDGSKAVHCVRLVIYKKKEMFLSVPSYQPAFPTSNGQKTNE